MEARLGREIVLRPRGVEDEAFVRQLFGELRAPEFASLRLAPSALEDLLTMQFRAQQMGFAAQFPRAEDQVVWRGAVRIGRLLVDRGTEAHHLVDLALVPVIRGLGIGTLVVNGLIEEARARNVPLRLQVRRENPAMRLYERLGFMTKASDGINVAMEIVPGAAAVQDAAGGIIAATHGSVVVERAPEASSAYFRTLVGRVLDAQTSAGEAVQLTLRSVEPLAAGAPRS